MMHMAPGGVCRADVGTRWAHLIGHRGMFDRLR